MYRDGGSGAIMERVVWAVVGLLTGLTEAQDDFGGGDDAGGADLDLESMMGQDGGAMNSKGSASLKPYKEKTFLEESTLALQQLGVIIGVAFMVGFLFMLMVGVEILWEKAQEKYQEVTGKPQQEEKDPASLVGTFSRYK